MAHKSTVAMWLELDKVLWGPQAEGLVEMCGRDDAALSVVAKH